MTTFTVDAPGCALTCHVRGNISAGIPLLMVGSPMPAEGFAALAAQFDDRPVVTYDPRGAGQSPRTDGRLRSTVQEHADDLRRVIDALEVERVDVFGSSGGALNALALAESAPPTIRALVAHEPPIIAVLPDRGAQLAASRRLHELYQAQGFGPAMALFLELIMLEGPMPTGWAERTPDPAAFGLPTEDDGRRDDPLLGLNAGVTEQEPDLEALRALTDTRVVLGHGAESAAQMPGRSAIALAEKLGLTSVEFPGHHGGFGPPDDPMAPGHPEPFAARLRDILDHPTSQEIS